MSGIRRIRSAVVGRSLALQKGVLVGTGLVFLATAGVRAQPDPRVEPSRTYAILGATVHTLAGDTIPDGTVILRDGVVQAVGRGADVPGGASVIDGTGLHVYPGLVDAFSRLGLTEIGQVPATEDVNELGRFNPQLRAYTAVHPASEHIPVARANGVTHALTAPGSGGGGFRGGGASGGIPGQAALLHLDGWTVEEMAIEPSAAMIVQWPVIQTRTFDFATFSTRDRPFTEAKKEYDEQVQRLEEWFQAARHYRQAAQRGDPSRLDRDLQLEALARTLDGELPVIIVANDRRGIESAVKFAERHGLHMILAGGRDAREAKELLAEKGIPVILGPTQSLPANEDDPYYYPFSLAGELRAAGVKIAFATFNSSDSRTLPYEAANAVPFGLPYEEALKAVTRYPAEILGIDDRLGTIEPGKVGNLIVTTGDPLEIQTRIEYVFIKGVPVDLDNRHRRLWEKYRKRPQRLESGRTTSEGGSGG